MNGEHPVTFLDGKTLRVDKDSFVAQSLLRNLAQMTKVKEPVGCTIIFDEPIARKSLAGDGRNAEG